MLQIGPLTIGNTVVSTSGMMLMFMQPCSLPITPSVIGWLNSTHSGHSKKDLK
jgi:hypothetical protein